MNQGTESRTDGRDNDQLRVRMLPLAEVAHLTGLGETTIYGLQALGDFPQSGPMTDQAVRWIESEIARAATSSSPTRGRVKIPHLR